MILLRRNQKRNQKAIELKGKPKVWKVSRWAVRRGVRQSSEESQEKLRNVRKIAMAMARARAKAKAKATTEEKGTVAGAVEGEIIMGREGITFKHSFIEMTSRLNYKD